MRPFTGVEVSPAAALLTPPVTAVRNFASDYVSLAKPRIVLLLLITAFTTMLIADAGWPGTSLVVITMLGTALAAGGANALNCAFDADIDSVMARTRGRPLPARRLSRPQALAFGLGTGALAFVLLAAFVNLLTAVIAIGALGFYVLVYTAWLKRTTPQNIVIGGAAGAAPPLIGWAAVTGQLGPEAWNLFAIIFYWTPPHFWALALLMANDYERAGVPMLSWVAGGRETRQQMFLYSALLIATTLIFAPIADMGAFYIGSAVVLGGLFLGLAAHISFQPTRQVIWRLWRYSIFYLALLFVAMVIDKLL